MIGFLNAASSATLALAIDAAAKGTVLMLVALIAHAMLGPRRVLARSALGHACLAGLLALPLASWALPPMRVNLLPVRGLATVPAPSLSRSVPTVEEDREAEGLSFGPSERPTIATPAPEAHTIAQPRPTIRLSASGFVFGVYLAGVVLLLSRLAVSLAAVARLRGRCEPIAEPEWLSARDRWSAWIGLKRRVVLLMSDRVSVPIVIGVFRPAIILPRSLAGTADSGLVDAILLHELSHIRRGDFGWNLAFKVVQALYWPHPMIWPLGRIVRAVREQACDDLCVVAMGGAPAYRASLIAVASGLVQRPDAALGLAMAHATNLGRRLSWIDRTRGASRCLPRWPVRLGLAVAVAILAGLLGSIELARATKAAGAPPQPPAGANAPPAAIDVVVVAMDTGKPLEGATVRPWLGHPVPSEKKTDRAGRLQIDISKRLFHDNVAIDVWADGYVQQRHQFNQGGARNPGIPSQVTIELLPGEQTLGGQVVDEAGRPIAGAKVVVWGYLGVKKDKHELAYMVDTYTDQKGQWRCRCFRDMTFAYLFLSHPDFLFDDGMRPRKHGRPRPSSPAEPDERPLQALRDFTDVQVMTRGVAIAGRVSDQQDKPVSGAEVGWFAASERDIVQDDMPTTTTDADGRFHFPHVRPARLMIQVKARGHAPGLMAVVAKEGAEPVAVKLEPPRTLNGRVMDSKNQPIADAFVSIHTWRGYRALRVYFKTGADGRFRWEDAPADPVLIDAGRVGYDGVHQQEISPEGGETLLTFRRAFAISGTVRDAATDKPIDAAQVEVGLVEPGTGKVTWQSNPRLFVAEGYLHGSLDAENINAIRLRIKAKGYAPVDSLIFRSDEGLVQFDARLTKSDVPDLVPVTGVVLRPDGRPLEGAVVTVTYPTTTNRGLHPLLVAHIKNGTIERFDNPPLVKTDRQGRFQTAREPDTESKYWAVVVVHPEFYAEVDRAAFEANPTIAARPWGRVEGFARIGNKLAAGETIQYYADRMGGFDVPYVYDTGGAKTDDRGHFVLDRLVPGDVRVSFAFGETPREMRAWSNGTLTEVKAGETAQVKLGGRGRPVVAKIALPPGFDPNDDYTANSQFYIQSDRPPVPYPKEVLARRDGSMATWSKAWYVSPEGHEYRRNWFVLRQAKLQSDGTLRADDVPPGEYRLGLVYSAHPNHVGRRSPGSTAVAVRQFSIPKGRDGEPFDLGTLRPRPQRTFKVGEAAPAFEVESLDGRRIKLQDFRGRYLLLTFWATWCSPCIAELPELKAIHERFSVDERFAMLSLSLDADKETPRAFVAAKGLRWMQGFLGEWVAGGAQEAYRVDVLPTYFLIGPDGKLKAPALRGDALETAIINALNEP